MELTLVGINMKMGRYTGVKHLELALALIIFLCPALGYPLHASNGAVNCTIFGEFKDPYTIVEPNGERNIILNVDVALIRSNVQDVRPIQVTYSLVDGNDKTYKTRDESTRSLQLGRQLLGFAVPPETIPKTLIVDPSSDSSGGNRFLVNFDEVANATNGKVTLLYYGILNSKINSNLKSIDFDVGIKNNDTRNLHISSKNFSLIDQWGWRYASLAYNAYTNDGFRDRTLMPNETARIKLSFGSISPLSRPSWLVYKYSNESSIMINIDPEAGLQQFAAGSKGNDSNGCCGNATEPAPTTLAGSIKATKARLQKVRESL
jgi:hypothetical protein